jgi:hypothetical protein
MERGGWLLKNMDHPESPMHYFRKSLDNEMTANISEQTNLYSVQSDPDKQANVTPTENKKFMGSLLYMSIYVMPHTEKFWWAETQVPQAADATSCNRWQVTKNNLHL